MGIYEITKTCEKALDMYEEYPYVYRKKKLKEKLKVKIEKLCFML